MSQNLKCIELRIVQAATQTPQPAHHSRMPRICKAWGGRGCLNRAGKLGWKRKSYLMCHSSCPLVLEAMQNFVQGSVFCLGKIPSHSTTEGLQEQSWHEARVTGGVKAYSETVHDPIQHQSKGDQVHQCESIHFLLLFGFFFFNQTIKIKYAGNKYIRHHFSRIKKNS